MSISQFLLDKTSDPNPYICSSKRVILASGLMLIGVGVGMLMVVAFNMFKAEALALLPAWSTSLVSR